MTSKGDRRRLQLFREFSANLGVLRPDLKGQYVCPLCLKGGFTEESALGNAPELTDEHCIPDGLGRTASVLTCAACNNTAGRNVDCHLHKRALLEAFGKGTQNKAINGRMLLEGHDMGVEITKTAGLHPKLDIKIIAKQSNLESVRNSQKAMAELAQNGITPNPIKFNLGPDVIPHHHMVHIALLKAAYLLLFKRVGFFLVFQEMFEPVRRQILETNSTAVPLDSIVLRIPLVSLPDNLCMVSTSNIEVLGVPVALTKYDLGFMVILPTKNDSYGEWSQLYQKKQVSGVHEFTGDFYPLDENLLKEHFFP
jgi:hypothetical protein